MRISALALVTMGLACTSAQAADLECAQLPSVLRSFTVHHYSVKEIDSGIRARTVDKYIDILDPSRSLFLESDVQKLQKDLPRVFDAMEKGTCTLLNDAAGLAIT